MERDTRLQDIFTYLLIYFFNISFGVPSKGTPPPDPPHGFHSESDAPFLESFFIHVDSPFYNMPDLKFIHIANHIEHSRKHLYYFTGKKKTKNTMPFSTSISNCSISVTAHKQGTIAVPQHKPLPRSSANSRVSNFINLRIPSSWEVVGI